MTKIALVLAVLVVLILVIVLAATRHLRSDDSDDLDPAPRARDRGRGGSDAGAPRADDPRPRADRHQGRGSRQGASQGHRAARRQDDPGLRAGPESGGSGARDHRDDRQPASAGPGVTDWDALSDVDYWAELTSERPLSAAAQPADPRPGRRDGGSSAGLSQDGRLPGGFMPAPAAGYPAPDSTHRAAAAPASTAGSRGFGQDAPASGQPSRGSRPAAADEDPLTSPSFPWGAVFDRPSRSDGEPSTGPYGPALAGAPTHQFPSYGSAAPGLSADPSRPHPAPGYPQAAGSADHLRPAVPAAPDGWYRDRGHNRTGYPEHPGTRGAGPGYPQRSDPNGWPSSASAAAGYPAYPTEGTGAERRPSHDRPTRGAGAHRAVHRQASPGQGQQDWYPGQAAEGHGSWQTAGSWPPPAGGSAAEWPDRPTQPGYGPPGQPQPDGADYPGYGYPARPHNPAGPALRPADPGSHPGPDWPGR